jgi:predicted ABC-type sugar transport system permease subunit
VRNISESVDARAALADGGTSAFGHVHSSTSSPVSAVAAALEYGMPVVHSEGSNHWRFLLENP